MTRVRAPAATDNLNNSTLPGQSGPIAEYAPYLEKIVAKLVAWAAPTSTKLLFGITTPMMCDADADAVVQSNNAAALAIMQKWRVPTVDLHAAVIGVCGAAPNTRLRGGGHTPTRCASFASGSYLTKLTETAL